MNYDAIVIGGGLGGLSAGAILARQGKKVMLLEQHYIPGGCATTFKRKDFIMEVGLHAMDGHLISQNSQKSVLRFLGIHKTVKFEPLPEFFHIRNQHVDFIFPHGIEKAVESLVKVFPGDETGIRKLFKIMVGVQEELSKIPRKKWRQILYLPLFPFLYPHSVKASRTTVGKCLDKYIKSEELKLILQGNLLYYHDDPYSMSMAFFAKAQASFIHHGSYFIRGGSQKLSDALTEVIRNNKGTVLLGKKVTQILTEKGKAVGVSYRDAFSEVLDPVKIHAHHIIHSGAIPLVNDLLTGPEKARHAKKFDGLIPSCSLTCVYLGFRKEIRQLPNIHYSTFIYGDDVHNLKDILPNNYGDWNKRTFVFVDYSQVDSGLAPGGKSVGVICAADKLSEWVDLDDHHYKKKKEEIAQILMGRLEKAIPGITELIEYYEVGTPSTIKRYTLNPFASPYGFAQIPQQSGRKRLAYQSPVKNLWLAGTWTFPGGGFTGAIVSGFIAGLGVTKKLNKEKPDTAPADAVDRRVVKLIHRAEVARNTLEFTFEKPEGFAYQPGQYAIVSLSNPKYNELDMPFRSFSLASHPDEKVVKFIMRKSESSFKRSCDALKAGDTATIFGPAGDFTLGHAPKGMVFLVSGIGISPVVPLLKELVKRKYPDPVFLFYSNRTREDAAFHQFLQTIELPDFHYIPVFTKSQDRISEAMICNELGHPGQFEYYIVGATGFLNAMAGILRKCNVPEEHLHMDDFG
jgi:all-trans-retinol 13,14-reductase